MLPTTPPDRRGFINKPTVIVGESAAASAAGGIECSRRENPTVAPNTDIIDRAQRAGKIRTLDMNKFLTTAFACLGTSPPPVMCVALPRTSLRTSPIKRSLMSFDRISTEGNPASVVLNEPNKNNNCVIKRVNMEVKNESEQT